MNHHQVIVHFIRFETCTRSKIIWAFDTISVGGFLVFYVAFVLTIHTFSY